MTNGYAGGLTASLLGPYLYFVRAKDLLYVGETQRHPVIRWCDHLSSRGSFRLAATNRAFVELGQSEPVAFFAYSATRLTGDFPEVQLKQATQAVEHELHVLLRAEPSFLGIPFRLVSDTEKTAPRTFRHWDLAGAIAREAAAALRDAMTAAPTTAAVEAPS